MALVDVDVNAGAVVVDDAAAVAEVLVMVLKGHCLDVLLKNLQ